MESEPTKPGVITPYDRTTVPGETLFEYSVGNPKLLKLQKPGVRAGVIRHVVSVGSARWRSYTSPSILATGITPSSAPSITTGTFWSSMYTVDCRYLVLCSFPHRIKAFLPRHGNHCRPPRGSGQSMRRAVG